LIGIPLDREMFTRKLNGPRDGNFTETFRARSLELSWTGYLPFASILSKLADDAERLGVEVHRRMTLENLSLAAKRKQVTIISHSRSAHFLGADLVDTEEIKAAIAADGGQAIPDEQGALADLLNAKYMPRPDVAEDAIGARIQFQMQLVAARQTVTGRIPGAFRGGVGVEFAAGFESPEAVASCVPTDFPGVIDLIVCNSLLVAELIHDRSPRSLVIGTSDVTFPETRLPFYLATLRLLERHPQPYEDAVQELKTILRRRFAWKTTGAS
jgi:hypothetical protein